MTAVVSYSGRLLVAVWSYPLAWTKKYFWYFLKLASPRSSGARDCAICRLAPATPPSQERNMFLRCDGRIAFVNCSVHYTPFLFFCQAILFAFLSYNRTVNSERKNRAVHDVDVLILGAGVSGLAAAHTLVKKKHTSFAILEARDRVGGRVFSAALPHGLTGEYGAEWIGATHKNLLRIARELGVSLESHTYTRYPFIKEELRRPDPALNKVLLKLERILSRETHFRTLDKKSLLAFLNEHFTKSEVALLRTIYSVEFAEDVRYVSAIRALLDHMTGGKNSHMDFHVKGGNTKLMTALVRSIGPHKVMLKHEVKSITQDHGGVLVECANGSIWVAKKVICTIPAQVLSGTHFYPPLPPEAKRTAQNLKYGDVVKAILTFPRRFWGREDFSVFSDGLAQYVFHTTQGQPGKGGALCMYVVGARAKKIRTMNMSSVWRELKKALPKEIDTKGVVPSKMTWHIWANDRFADGAYAVYQPREWARVRRAFGKPFHHVYFSGEHLALMQGFMEGAATEGINAATKISKVLAHKK